MLVAHGHLISLFSVTKQKWIKHFAFDHEIELIFRQKDEFEEFDLYVLLKDGTIHVINQRNNKNPDVDEFTIDETCGFQLEGKIGTIKQDREDNNWTFIITSRPDDFKDSGFTYCLNIFH